MKIVEKLKSICPYVGITNLSISVLVATASIDAWDFTAMPYVGICAVLGVICLAVGGAFEV